MLDEIVPDEFDGDLKAISKTRYSEGYKQQVFQIWYNSGKPIAVDLLDMIPNPETNYGRKPSAITIHSWIAQFQEQAESLDLQVREKIDQELVLAKVEMVKRHAEVGKEAQKIALEWLRSNPLTAAAAVRLLFDGAELERGALGIPEALSKLVTMTDEQLLEELKKELESGKIEVIEPDED